MQDVDTPFQIEAELPQLPSFIRNSVGLSWVVAWIRKRIQNNLNVLCAMVGDPGMGKSYAALKIGEIIDPDFNTSHIAFTVLQLMELVNGNYPKGSVFILDDAGLAAGSREWYSQASKVLGWLSQSVRFKNYIIIITVPSIDMIESQSRKLISLLFMTVGHPGRLTPRIPYKPNVITSHHFQPIHFEFPRVIYRRKLCKIKVVGFPMPKKETYEPYETAKSQYISSTYSKYINKLKAKENKELMPKRPVGRPRKNPLPPEEPPVT